MRRRPDLDAAIEHLRRYSAGQPWASHRLGFLATMLGPIPDDYGLDLEQLFHEVQQIGHVSSLMAYLDESFFAAEHGDDRANVIDEYLRRRGWQETPRARAYLQGIRTTAPSLWEVQDVGPGEWIDVRDRLREAPARRVVEHTASQTLRRWDCFVARVVEPRGETMLTAGVLSLTREIADDIEQVVRKAAHKGDRALKVAARKSGIDAAALGDIADTTRRLAGRVYFQLWLRSLLELSRRPLPTLQNTDGDPLLLTRTRLPIAPGATAEVVRRLDALAEWSRDDPDSPEWTWKSASRGTQSTILCLGRLDRGALVLETNSRRRMESALAAVRPALGELVGDAPMLHEDVMHKVRDGRSRRTSSPVEAMDTASAGDAATLAAALTQFKDQHYRRTLDDPVPMLGNQTPRQCARTKQGRIRLVRWLKQIENGELQQAEGQGAPPYDTAWMWKELGVEP